MLRRAAPTLETGTLVGRYEIVRLIGRGGMGEVFEATHQVTGRRVALKIASGMGADEELRQRFLREAQAAAALDHPNVVDVLDAFEDRAGPVLVMELLQGESLGDVLARRQVLDLATLAPIVVPVCRALKVAHARGMVHRDLKPDNIFLALVTDTGVVPKILDFGIVKVRPGDERFSERGGETQTGAILGTPFYMSLEQAMGEREIDLRADVWSLGVIIYKALSGRRPLEFRSLGEMYQAFLERQVPPIRTLVPTLPEDVAAVIDAMVRVRRETRLADLDPLIAVMSAHASTQAMSAKVFLPTLGRPERSSISLGAGEATSVLEAGGEGASPAGATPHPGRMSSSTARGWQTEAAGAPRGGLDVGSLAGPAPRWGRRIVGPTVTFLVLAGCLVAGAVVLTRNGDVVPPADSARPRAAETPPDDASAEGDVAADGDPTATSTEAPPAEEAPEAAPTAAPSVGGATARPPSSRPPTSSEFPHSPPPQPAKPATDPCQPPYVVDDNGVKRFKPECL